jgi:hypothetical protein
LQEGRVLESRDYRPALSFIANGFSYPETLLEYYNRVNINPNPNPSPSIQQENNLHTQAHQESNSCMQQKYDVHIQQKTNLNIQQTTSLNVDVGIHQNKIPDTPSKNLVHPISIFGASDLKITSKNYSCCCSCGRPTIEHPSLYSAFNYYAIDSNCPYRFVK